MPSAKEHYDTHLGDFYAWMVGDFDEAQQAQQAFFENNGLLPTGNKVAIDLGAGHGLQAVSLAKLGFEVKALDFNQQLLLQLESNKRELPIQTIQTDITQFPSLVPPAALIVCMGDTLAHLESFQAVEDLIQQSYDKLVKGGKLVLSYRNYAQALEGNGRFIPVKADDERIHTCVLDFHRDTVVVTDQLYERIDGGWQLKLSSYEKLRLTVDIVKAYVQGAGFKHLKTSSHKGMFYTIASKH